MQQAKIETIETMTHVKQTKKGGRIWLEGDKLVAAGFVGGSQYSLQVVEYERGRSLFLTLNGVPGQRLRKVSSCSGGSRPIIDLHSRTVLDWFPAGTELRAVFFLNSQTIRIMPV